MEIGVKQLCSRWGLAFSYQWEDAVYCGLHGVQVGNNGRGGWLFKKVSDQEIPNNSSHYKNYPYTDQYYISISFVHTLIYKKKPNGVVRL